MRKLADAQIAMQIEGLGGLTVFEFARRAAEGYNSDPQLAELIHTAMLRAANTEVERRRGFERECNQQFAENVLLRNECHRLREVVSTLSQFITESHENADEAIPEEIAAAVDALFPALAGEDRGMSKLTNAQIRSTCDGLAVRIASDVARGDKAGAAGRRRKLVAYCTELAEREAAGQNPMTHELQEMRHGR